MRLGRACRTNGEKKTAYGILVDKPEGKTPLGRQRCRWIILKWILEKYDGSDMTGLI
jgi:hypothetical protein